MPDLGVEKRSRGGGADNLRNPYEQSELGFLRISGQIPPLAPTFAMVMDGKPLDFM